MEATNFIDTLPESLRDFVTDQASAQGHPSADAYVLSLLQAEQDRLARQEVNKLIQEAVASGPATPLTKQDWEEIKSHVLHEFGSGSARP